MSVKKPKIIVVMPAFYAEKTIEKTVREIPKGYVDEIILVDDASMDKTAEVAKRLGITVYRHSHNLGYGGNQKTCYWEAMHRNPDVVVMLHPDYQYDGTKIPSLVEPIICGDYDMMFGSRIKSRGAALLGGMPKSKYFFNRLFTLFANILLGENLSEYMSGLRAYSTKTLSVIPFQRFSNDYVFDQQFTVSAISSGLRIGEIPIPTRYHDQQHTIRWLKGLKFGVQSIWEVVLYLLHKFNLYHAPIFSIPSTLSANTEYSENESKDESARSAQPKSKSGESGVNSIARVFRKIFYPLLILFLCLVALRSLISVPFYTSHDGFTHTARIAAYYGSIKDGQFPAKWSKNLNENLGSPIFVYSYPLVYMIGAGMHFAGMGYEDIFRLIIGGGYALSGLTMFWWLKHRFGAAAAFMGSVFYLWAPYRFLDIYVRGAIAENFAYIFLPLILLGIDQIFKAKSKINRWWLLLTLSTIGMLLGHNVVSAMFLPVAFVWMLLHLFKAGNTESFSANRKAALLVVAGLVLAFLSSSFIYLPDLFERGFIHFDQGISYWPDHFVYLHQFIRDKWGYGFDLPGSVNDSMSFGFGLANWLVLGLLVPFLILKRKADRFLVLFLLVFIFIVVVAVYNPASNFIWLNTPVMKTIVDFPWRWFGLLALVMGYASAYLITNTSKLLIIFFLAAVLIANRNHLRVNEAVTFGDSTYDHYSGTATATSNEYTPAWHTTNFFTDSKLPRAEKIEGDLDVQVGKYTTSGLKFTVRAKTSGIVRINWFYFPQTVLFKNGHKLEKNIDWEVDNAGTIKLRIIPPGGVFLLRQEETDLRILANYLTLFGIVAIGGVSYVTRKV